MAESGLGEIVNLVNLYALAVDTRSWALFDQVFTPDIAIDFGGPAAWNDLAALKAGFAAIHDPFKSTQHFTSNHQIKITGEQATCTSYVRGQFFRDMPAGGNRFESTGWYDDLLIRTAQGWRIKRRSCRLTWWDGNPKVLETAPGAGVSGTPDSLAAEAGKAAIFHLSQLLRG